MRKAGESAGSLPIPTPVGKFVARYSETGLCGLEFPGGSTSGDGADVGFLPQERRWHAATTRAVKLVLNGQSPGELPPLDLGSGTAFQQRVWQALLKIPSGKTRSYAEVAKEIGRPAATRAVGSACGANPIPLLVPCHRVLAANGKIGGFSAGLDWKRLLLSREKSWPDSLFS